ncbi:MAG: hypothetical protein J5582_12810 [Ruminococcus sp.]|uniref:hypothetical protein n=1 Tax=Ruminococcus sp. TaxID=41978 RepID=UPI0025F5683D|nr:hypothetical protein [Ruminococcus sp.]MBO4867418.1 hypothetical protein [Ruminococcus sp.]
MTKLLKTNFYRLFHSKVYWICLLLMSLLNIYNAVASDELLVAHEVQGKYGNYWTGWNFMEISTYLAHLWYISYIIIAVTILFVGDDYSSGSIRNKILAGHSRFKIYLSYFITSYVGAMVIHIICEVLGLSYCLARFGMKYYHITSESIKDSLQLCIPLNISAVVSIATFVAISLLCMIATARRVPALAMALVLDMLASTYVEDKMNNVIMSHGNDIQADKRALMLLSLEPHGLIKSNMVEWNSYHTSCILCCLITLFIIFTIGIIVMRKRELR